MDHTTIRMGGVPEHFNLPIHLAKEAGEFEGRGINLEWITYHGGTGEMTAALKNDEVDVCILLTEGAIASIVKGNKIRLISEYVITPLTWGIHTGARNPLQHYSEIWDKRFAISRFGSGSHLMAIVDANSKSRFLEKDQFVPIKTLDGALESLDKLESDVFYWEKFTTKPYVDSGQLRRVGEYRTPWPCFVIVATEKILAEQPQPLIRLLRTIHDYCDKFMHDNGAPEMVSQRYGITVTDAERWYHNTEWAIHGWISDKMVSSVIYHLKSAGILAQDAVLPEIIWKRQ